LVDLQEYHTLLERIEVLLQNPDIIENQQAKGHIELNVLSDLVADYESKTSL